jgi:membrane associated rhomboid family serine protease
MGIYDRDYYRDDDGGWWSSMAGKQTTVALIIVTGVIGLLQSFSLPNAETDPIGKWFEFNQSKVLGGQIWRIVTPVFLTDFHTAYPISQLALWLILLYFVGIATEAIYGTREFLAFYLAAGFAVYLVRFLVGVFDLDLAQRASGPGGAVVAALVLLACHRPYERVLLFFVIPMPIWALALAAVVINLLVELQDGIGYPTHLVGALFAMGYFRQQVRLIDMWDRLTRPLTGRRRVPRLSIYDGRDEIDEEVPVHAAAGRAGRAPVETAGRSVDEQLEAKLDQVLEKVSRTGRESLTPEENQILLRASEIYKRRRGH